MGVLVAALAAQQPCLTHKHTHVHQKLRSELVVVPGKVFSIVGGLTSHEHVPVFKDLLFGQHLVLRFEDKAIAK